MSQLPCISTVYTIAQLFTGATTRRVRRATAGPLRVGFVGSWTPQKGLDVLLRAQAALPAGLVRLTVHGSGDARPAYAEAAKALGRGGEVTFAGPFAPSDAPRVFRELDLLVMPSIWYENAPLVISEAFAMGVPVIASRLGGMAEMVRDGIDGRLFAPGDSAELARILEELARDREALARLAAGVRPPRALADDVEGLRDLYRELIGRSR